jgi:hypothetical protein
MSKLVKNVHINDGRFQERNWLRAKKMDMDATIVIISYFVNILTGYLQEHRVSA